MDIRPQEKIPGVKRRRVLMLPNWRHGNPYLNLLSHSLESRDVRVVISDCMDGWFNLNRLVAQHAPLDILHIHWLPDILAPFFWTNNQFKRKVKKLTFALDILLLRARGIKVVWTVHNLVEHESPDPHYEIELRALLARLCSGVIFHSEGAMKLALDRYRVHQSNKHFVIPHGNYSGCYSLLEENADQYKLAFDISENELTILYFGAIRGYKGVLNLVQAFSSNKRNDLRLIIAGKPFSDELRTRLVSTTTGDGRIKLLLDFIPEDHVAALFSIADVVALPFERTLTSGSAVLAMTMGKALLLPDEARIFHGVSDECAIFYHTPDGLISEINQLNKADLRRKSEAARQCAAQFDWAEVASQTELAYHLSPSPTVGNSPRS